MFEHCNTSDPGVIEKLISEGADVNEARSDGVTPLMVAANLSPNPDVISLLISAGRYIQKEATG